MIVAVGAYYDTIFVKLDHVLPIHRLFGRESIIQLIPPFAWQQRIQVFEDRVLTPHGERRIVHHRMLDLVAKDGLTKVSCVLLGQELG